MGRIQRNEKLVSLPKIGLTAKQFRNGESRWILRIRGPCCSQNVSLQENQMIVKLAIA